MKLKAISVLLLLPVTMVVLVACTSGPSEADINATVEARVEQAKASLVAPTAVPLPTYTPEPIPTPILLPTYTPLPIPTPQVIIKEAVVTATPTATATPTPTSTPIPTPTPTATPTATPTPTPTPIPKRMEGTVTFDYSNNNGRFVIGEGELKFETKWTKRGGSSIYVYNDPSSIEGLGLALDASTISDVTDATQINMSSRYRAPQEGEIVVFRNNFGNYAAVQVIDVKDRTRSDNRDELTFEYVIIPAGRTNFAPTPTPTPTPTPINGPQCLVWEASGKVPEPTPTGTPTPMPTPTHVVLYPTATPAGPTPIPTTIPDPANPISVSFELQEGWNIITIPLYYKWRYLDPTSPFGIGRSASGLAKPVNPNPDAFFGNTNISIAMTTSGSYPIELGVPCKPEDYDANQINKVNLTEISSDTTYWVYAKSSHKFTYDVTYYVQMMPYLKPVHKGWNFLNFPYTVSNIYRDDSGANDAQFGETITSEPRRGFQWSQALEYSPATGGFITILPNTNATFTIGKGYYFLLDNAGYR